MTSTPSKLLAMLLPLLLSVSFGFSYNMKKVKKYIPMPTQRWMEQRLDHVNLNARGNKTWYQRYYENLQYYMAEGPVFLHIGGEHEIESQALRVGHMMELANKFQAAVFGLEHRYYGMSIPVNTNERKPYQYLSTEQALADLAHFIRYIKQLHPELQGAKVIVFGCSYPGNLAAWMRLKYPDLVYGAVASSAPLQAQVDFPEYFETVGESLKKRDPQCEATIRNATAESEENMDKLRAIYSMISLQELERLESNHKKRVTGYAHFIGEVVQNQYKRIPELCNSMTNGILPLWKRYTDVMTNLISESSANIQGVQSTMKKRFSSTDRELYETAGDPWSRSRQQCEADIQKANADLKYIMEKTNYVKKIQDMFQSDMLGFSSRNDFEFRANSIADYVEQRFKQIPEMCNEILRPYSWQYQCCNEFGYLTMLSEKQPFGKGFQLEEEIENHCYDYGIDEATLYSNVKRTNDNYGGRHPNVTRVVFVNGDLDPWHKLGITTDLNPESPAILIEGTSHCTDTYGHRWAESKSFHNALSRIEQEVAKWVGR